MKKIRVYLAFKLIKWLDMLLDVNRDHPIYVAFLGDGEVQIYEPDKQPTNLQF